MFHNAFVLLYVCHLLRLLPLLLIVLSPILILLLVLCSIVVVVVDSVIAIVTRAAEPGRANASSLRFGWQRESFATTLGSPVARNLTSSTPMTIIHASRREVSRLCIKWEKGSRRYAGAIASRKRADE